MPQPRAGLPAPPPAPGASAPGSVLLTERLGPLRALLLLMWALGSFGLMYFAADLRWVFGGWPLGYWLAAQGIIVFFVVLVAVYAWIANRAEARQAAQVVDGAR